MNTQQLIAAIKAATKTREVLVPGHTGWNSKVELTYLDADAFLEAVEGLASALDSLKVKL